MSEFSKSAEDKIQELQLLEQNLQAFSQQKQGIQLQLLEIESALKELEGVDEAYRIVGPIMVQKTKKELQEELGSKKELSELKLGSLEKQETKLRDRASKIQKEVLGELKGDA